MLVGPKMWIIEVNVTVLIDTHHEKSYKRTNPWETYQSVGTFRNELFYVTGPSINNIHLIFSIIEREQPG